MKMQELMVGVASLGATGSPVSRDYFDRRPFTFSGTIERVQVKYAD